MIADSPESDKKRREMARKQEKVLAWHFVRADRALANEGGNGLIVEPGFIYSETGATVLCDHGMHASIRAYDALSYAPGPWICRVCLWGDIKHQNDKLVAQHREVMWMADASRELRLFACWCVRHTPITGGRTTWDLLTDKRSREVVEVAGRYAVGRASDSELDAALDAAWSAALDAAWSATLDAALDAARAADGAAARAAALDAALDAARAAALDAARSAARGSALGSALDAARAAALNAARAADRAAALDAARAADRAAALAAALDAARDAQSVEFERRMLALEPRDCEAAV